jgi:PKD repeat protein
MSTSTERNPTHVYTNPGVYSVTLTVYGVGGTDSYTRTGYITVNTPTYVLTATVYPDPGAATITGLGTYSYGDTVTLTATGTPKPEEEGYVDIVFLVDESGSMTTEHTWLTTLPNTLEAALVAANIGAGANPNQYALVGFGSTDAPTHGTYQNGHKHTVGGGDWGTAAQLCTAASGLVVAGSAEDGYQAADFAFNNYTFRAGAVKLFVLITDEDRDDITGGTVTKASITAELQGGSVLLAGCLNLAITDSLAQTAIGRKGNTVYKGTLVAPYFTTGTLGTIATGDIGAAPNVVADYCDVAEVVPAAQPDGGTEWDLNILRNGGSDAVSFTAAFVDAVKNQILVALNWSFSYWSINGTPVYTNPYSFVITGPTTIGLMMG